MKNLDFIILGASGYTGQFILEEVGRICKDNKSISYAIAGRNKSKLENSLKLASANDKNIDFSDINIIITDVNDASALLSMARQTKIVINCVGPYRFYGKKVVDACLEAGTDHIDISGEPEYLEEVQMLYNEKAKEKHVYVIGSCGFDSIPADMGTIFLQENFLGDLNSIDMIVGMDDTSKGSAAINVTTLECALHGYNNRGKLGNIRRKIFKDQAPRSFFKPEVHGTAWWSTEANRWCVPNMTSDRSVVLRTQNLNYNNYQRRPTQINAFFGISTIWAVISAVLFGILFSVMAPFSFTRNLFLEYPSLFTFGAFSKTGAKREDLLDLKFKITFVGHGWDTTLTSADEQHQEPPTVTKVAQVTGPDPGYFGAAIMLVQTALTLLEERKKLPNNGGVLTPGSAFIKTSLIDRLEKKGINFKMISK